jgi:hypothetical protein
MSIYKMCLYYEKIAIFETLYGKEKLMDKIKGSNIITESFSYCIVINNITVALYLLKKYIKELYFKNEIIIDSILSILNEYSESNGAVRYHHGISHLEELLYFIEIFLKGFTYGQCFFLFKILIKLSTCGEWENEELDHYNRVQKSNIIEAYKTNKFRTHFLVYSYNPLKIIVSIITICIKIMDRFPTLKVSGNYFFDIYFKVANQIIINYQEIDQIRDLLHDKMYNGKLVIDQIADYDMHDILNSRKPLVIVREIWEGRYDDESFLNYSTAYL